jgi:hypothetical protein
MRSFIAGCVIAVVLAVAGWAVLQALQQPAAIAFSTEAVRL